MLVTCWVLLRLKECIKVPEGALNEIVRRHLSEPHLQEDLSELRADLEQGVQVATIWEHTTGREVVGFERSVPPRATGDHLWAQLCLLLRHACAEGLALAHPVGFQDPVNTGGEGTLMSSPEPLDTNPRTNYEITLVLGCC